LFLISGAEMAPTLMMAANHEPSGKTRQNLRLKPEVWAAIDEARARRSGHVPRNTWIAEAIAEKLERDKKAPGGSSV
jgi:hypothetical protein